MANKDLFIGIAVANADGLRPLPSGLYRRLDELKDWAASENYDVWDWSDENGETLTSESIRQDIEGAGKSGSRLNGRLSRRRRILLYFCGHGFFEGQQIWVLSDGIKGWNALLGVSRLYNRLRMWTPQQIGIISDACASLGTDMQFRLDDFVPEPQNPQTSHDPQKDSFRASRDGQSTYALNSGPIFSELVIKALKQNPPPPEAVSKRANAVISQSLTRYLEKNFANAAQKAGGAQTTVDPLLDPGFLEEDDVYRYLPTSAQEGVSLDSELDEQSVADARKVARRTDAKIELNQVLTGPDLETISIDESITVRDMTSSPRIFTSLPSIGADAGVEGLPGSPGPYIKINTSQRRGEHNLFKLRSGDGQDSVNGMIPIEIEGVLYLVPEFEGCATWVVQNIADSSRAQPTDTLLLSSIPEQRGLRQTLRGVSVSTRSQVATRIETDGVSLLNSFREKASDQAFVEALLLSELKSLAHDPLYAIAVSYFCHRSGRGDWTALATRHYLEDARGAGVPFEIPLLAGLPIYQLSNSRHLWTFFDGREISLSTELPLLPYGWSLLRGAELPVSYRPIVEGRKRLTSGILPIIEDEESRTLISDWLYRTFGRRTIGEASLYSRY